MRNYEADTSDGRYRQTVAPTLEPVTLEEARAQCSIMDGAHDVLLSSLITAARNIIERRHERQLLPATWTLALDNFPDEIEIRKTPVTAVTQIAYVDQTGTPQVFNPLLYQFDVASPNQRARVRPVWGTIWPITRTGYVNALVVTFTAGYASPAAVPIGYRRAILMMVAQMFLNRGMDSEGAVHAERAFEWLLQSEDPGAYA